jgi:hypothetical protein
LPRTEEFSCRAGSTAQEGETSGAQNRLTKV